MFLGVLHPVKSSLMCSHIILRLIIETTKENVICNNILHIIIHTYMHIVNDFLDYF